MSETAQATKVTYQRYKPVDINRKHKDNLNILDRFGVVITRAVGTMITAVLFTGLALISLPAAIKTTFLQLVLLPIIMVGQNIQGKHSETLADEEFKTTQTTYQDLEHLILVNKKQLDLLVDLSEAKKA
jgi:uncharacterized membrane protein